MEASIEWSARIDQALEEYPEVQEYLDAIRGNIEALADRLEAARELHRKVSRYGDEECSVPADEYLEAPDEYPGFKPFDVCEHCMDIEVSIQGDYVHWIGIESSWPCPTIRAIEGDQ